MINGLVAFPITPMDADGRIDAAALGRLVRAAVEAGVDAVCVLGSTGTYAYLSREERCRAIEVAAEQVHEGVPLLAGVGALRTDMAVHHARDARRAGAAMGLLAPMSYTPLTNDEVFAHLETVAAEGGLPLCVYDNPAATHFSIGDDLFARLANLPGVLAAKSPAPPASAVSQRLAALRSRASAGVSIGVSGDANGTEALIAGADAWYSVLGGLFPAPLVAIRRAVAAGNMEGARRVDQELRPIWDLFKDFGAIRVIYAAANLTGACQAAPPRPILPLSGATLVAVADAVKDLASVLVGGKMETPIQPFFRRRAER